jgi:hypothetical protein
MGGQRLGNTNAFAGCCNRLVRLSEEQFGPLLDKIRGGGLSRLSLPNVLVQTAPAAERESPACDFNAVDAAVHLARAAGKSADQLHLRRGKAAEVLWGVR